ncbi:multiheme c-type cytochrome [Geomesophilobacter sediminis]|uniref:Cytochrome c3 family protein n=1 Tax=Geomesophilobacter sediminis TaxID=2798584 RepID=A0A8J7M207_9BACT|nr:multiheme c-type cytochrome [Geomesophilobacter sediminis]MBJ6727249.1 cytochrome c3 family protein [Geomesophilobacter sediminis]
MGLSSALLFVALLIVCLPWAASAADQPQEPVCIQCHSQLPDRLGEPVKLWKQSVHAENGIACNGCHGGDPTNAADAMNRSRGFLGAPKEADIPAFCGRCHVGVLKDYLASAHGRALGKGGPTCVTCHSNHLVTRASINIINEKTCTQCHTFERAKLIKDAMQATETRIVAISGRIDKLKAEGVDTERMEKATFAVRNRFHTLFHDVNVTRVTQESGAIGAELAKQEKELARIDEIKRERKIAGAIVVAALIVLAILFHLLKKTYD